MPTPQPSHTCASSAAAPRIAVQRDPIEQWLHWEEQANLAGFRTATAPVELAVAEVPLSSVTVTLAGGRYDEIARCFLRDRSVLYPKHPLNADPSVAFFHEPPVEFWRARFTSSRTLVVRSRGALFAVKLPTDHPHPSVIQPEKTKLREEARDALRVAALIDRVDRALGPDPDLLLLREMIAVLVRGSESGVLVRDLRPLQDGCYYLPALSIPFAGRELARLHGADFETFWGRFYAEPAGRAKAKLAARYGLQYETPNPQNLLVQLDRELAPTGVMALRDLGDAEPVSVDPEAPWSGIAAELRPETENSFWAFEGADECGVPRETLARWYQLHERAYCDELASFFGAPPVGLDVSSLGSWLRTREGRAAAERAFELRARA